VEYTRDLGYGAIRYLLRGGTGALITQYEGRLRSIPFVDIIDYSTGKVNIRRVDVRSETYEAAQKYMIKLLPEDLQGDALESLARTVDMTPQEFVKRFGYIVQSDSED
jgi:hypothetical protein